MVPVLSLLLVAAGFLASGAAGVDPTPYDWRLEVAAGITLLSPVFTRLLVHLGFLFVDRIPKWALPTVAVLLGTGVDFLSGLHAANPMLGALAVVAALGLRELIDRFFTGPLGLKNLKSQTDPADARYLIRRAA